MKRCFWQQLANPKRGDNGCELNDRLNLFNLCFVLFEVPNYVFIFFSKPGTTIGDGLVFLQTQKHYATEIMFGINEIHQISIC